MEEQYGRLKGADWFPLLNKREIIVIGQGGIGSWVSLLLARIGCILFTYDMDYFEDHNMSGQFVKSSSIGEKKTIATAKTIKEFCPDSEVYENEEYGIDTPTNDIIICGLDNMRTRKIAFLEWKNFVNIKSNESEKKNCFFQDGRLLAEHLQIFNIPGDREDLIKEYEENYLFDDSSVQEAECTFKQTSHCAAMIASHMVGFLTNWASNSKRETPFKQVPFFYEYIIPLNRTK